MYIVCAVTTGGFIQTLKAGHTIHRESDRIPGWPGIFCAQKLMDAKALWDSTKDQIIVQLDRRGAAEALWMAKTQFDVLKPRLDIWKGCYGAWPIKFLNA